MPLDINDLTKLLKKKQSKYCPEKPFPKQLAFAMLPHREALFGGSLGSGKSSGVLQLMFNYIHIPGFSGLIFRRTLSDHKLKGAPLDRMIEWMAPFVASKEVKYVASEHKFLFKTYHPVTGERCEDSCIQFGYIGESNARVRYQGAEFNIILWDELTQHVKTDYEYMFTRLRKCVCPTHLERDEDNNPIYYDDCQECKWAREIPTYVRGTCNPDGLGFAWVKEHFKISPNMTEEEAAELGVEVKWIGKDPDRPFLPATFLDNPHLNHKEYGDNLKASLSDDMYAALVLGSWGVVPNAKFKKKWKKVYSQYHNLMYLGRNQQGAIVDSRSNYQKVFLTVDTATTAEEGPGDIDMFPTKVKNPSYTVICSWALTECYKLLWLEMMRFREEIPEVVDELKAMYERWNPAEAVVEENGVGKGVSQFAARMGMNIVGLHKSKDKVENATEAILQMKKGRIWLPEYADWLEEAESELFTWQGHPKETDDIIDNVAHACNHIDWTKAPDHHQTSSVQPQIVTAERIPGAYRPKSMYQP